MAKAIEDLFYYIATYSPVLPFLLFLALGKKSLKNTTLSLVALYSALELATNILAIYVSPRNIILLYSIFTLVEFSLFASIFYFLLGNRTSRVIVLALGICYVIFWGFYKYFGNYKSLDSIPISVETILILGISFAFLHEQADQVSGGFLYERYSFWVTAGILIYLAGSFFSYLFSNELDRKMLAYFWTFTNVCASIKNILFIIAMYLFREEKAHTVKQISV